MLDELKTAKKVVGIKQAIKAVECGIVKKAFIAREADEKVIGRFQQYCTANSIHIEYVDTMQDLGKACGIDVGAAVAVILND